MKKPTERSRALHYLFALACIAGATAGCTADGAMIDGPTAVPNDAAVASVDPTGNWSLSYAFDAGCGQPATTATTTFTVTRGADGYALAIAGAMTSGTLICTPADCKLSAIFAWSNGDVKFQQSANMTLDTRDVITGNGTESVVTASAVCSFAFTVHGSNK